MWLVNQETLKIEQHRTEDAPEYVILSHRWQGEETSMQDFINQCQMPEEKRSRGTTKVVEFCGQAHKIEATHVWVDTVCIDKTSSAELQEAINSMYQWYKQATMCVVYLVDVDARDASSNKGENGQTRSIEQQLAQSEWFTRGWTLQELVAPQKLIFVDRHWTHLGSRDDFADVLRAVTGINPLCYGNQAEILKTTIAERMSWLGSRKTTRVEDLAYCMIGIFDVNISMLYGEGPKAFTRLQKEIIQEVDDDSIFAWQSDSMALQDSGTSILAPHPSCFRVYRDQPIEKGIFFDRDTPRWTAKGLEVELYGERRSQFGKDLKIVLNCTVNAERVCIPIVRAKDRSDRAERWTRADPSKLKLTPDDMLVPPPSTRDVFDKDVSNFMSRPDIMNGSRSGVAWRAKIEYEREPIRFKVYVI